MLGRAHHISRGVFDRPSAHLGISTSLNRGNSFARAVGDGAAWSDTASIHLVAKEDAELLLFDMTS